MAVTELLSSEDDLDDNSSDTLVVATVEADDSMACLFSLAVEVELPEVASSVIRVDGSCLVCGCSGSLGVGVGVGAGAGAGAYSGTGAGIERVSRGSRTFFCLIQPTIFSKAPGLICLSLPLDLLSQESSRVSSGRTTCGGGDWRSSSCS